MDIQTATDTLAKFRNVLGSVEALDKVLTVASSLEQAVKELTNQRSLLAGEVAALNAALHEGGVSLAKLENSILVKRADEEKARVETREHDEAEARKKLEIHNAAFKSVMEEHQREQDRITLEIHSLKTEKKTLESSVYQLRSQLDELKRKAAAV